MAHGPNPTRELLFLALENKKCQRIFYRCNKTIKSNKSNLFPSIKKIINSTINSTICTYLYCAYQLKMTIYKSWHWNLGIGIEIGIGTAIGTNTTNAIISSSIMPVDTKPS